MHTCSALQQISALALEALESCSALRQVSHHECGTWGTRMPVPDTRYHAYHSLYVVPGNRRPLQICISHNNTKCKTCGLKLTNGMLEMASILTWHQPAHRIESPTCDDRHSA